VGDVSREMVLVGAHPCSGICHHHRHGQAAADSAVAEDVSCYDLVLVDLQGYVLACLSLMGWRLVVHNWGLAGLL
jgi:hypothetical protein